MNFKFLLILVIIAFLIMELDARKPPKKGKKGHRRPKGHKGHGKGKGLGLGFSFSLGNYHDKGEGGGWGDAPPLRLPRLKVIKPKVKFIGARLKFIRPKLIVKGPKLKFY